ncbi:hypothetical protein TcasGA2_TC015873 [Tribolium castaneum]|uniref:Uncharacterized protein n=1 Tax=Tribolium castaneum TaxID=7070 RepID=D7ELZ3_TRICA|nr:hypothetical protein TcasGA2_TC015873 [Tribolium castaneum]
MSRRGGTVNRLRSVERREDSDVYRVYLEQSR